MDEVGKSKEKQTQDKEIDGRARKKL